MSVSAIQQALTAARRDGRVDTAEVDRIMIAARDGGGLDAQERAALLQAADGFDDASKQRLLSHLAVMAQKNAWVDVDVGQVASVEGRYAKLSTGVAGLSAKVGMFDNCFSLKGKATADGALRLNIEGKSVSVQVKKGDTAEVALEKLKAQLPQEVTGVVLKGDAQPYDAAAYTGAEAARTDTAAHLMLYKPAALALKPGEKPMRVVVTGYGAFMGITDNPSANMAQKLAEAGVKGAIVEYRRLDVTPAAVDACVKEMKGNPPDVILSMGVSGGQAQVEERPENHLGAAEDGNGQLMRDRKIRPGGPQELKTDLPVDAIDWALGKFGHDRRVFTSMSDPAYQPDRSAYLCNYLGYSLASEFGPSPATIAGFMHINRETPVDQMHAALEAVVAKQLEWKRAQGTTPPTS